MPIHEIRESIELPSVTTDATGFAIVQKEINLKENMSHKMLQCDVFIDNPIPVSSADYVTEILVTPTPVIYTDMPITGLPSRAPAAAVDNVLFKQISIANLTLTPSVTEFPNRFISARPTFTWYHPKLYLTLFVHGQPRQEINDIAISLYCAVESKKVSLVTYGMGVIREDHQAQVAAVMSNGRTIEPARNVGQTYPMWQYGGVRPEFMLSGANVGDFFQRNDSQDPSTTQSSANLRLFAKSARTMVPNIDAFGESFGSGQGIPDWIRMFMPEGIASGPIRDQWPPTKHADNGNVLTL